MALSDPDRTWVVEQLLEVMSPEDDEMTDDQLAAELDRRRAEFERDPSVGIPWSEVRLEE
jgi:putative addiction module component (TIGR02574 family)